MTLKESVEFTAHIQRGHRIQVPIKVRWAYKLEPEQILQVELNVDYLNEKFHASLTQHGRITIPKRIATRYPHRGKTWQETPQKSPYNP